jgi:hypothetical protein
MPYKLGTEIKCDWGTIAFTGKAVVITHIGRSQKRIPIGAISVLDLGGGSLFRKPNLTIVLTEDTGSPLNLYKTKETNENCVFYDKKTIPEINAMIEAIEEAM